MAPALIELLAPHPVALLAAVAADLAIGDPVYGTHPVRLVGAALTWLESGLRRIGADGYAGGVALFLGLATLALGASAGLVALAAWAAPLAGWAVHAFLLYSLLALGDLLRHVWGVEQGLASSLDAGRAAIARLVGRDTDRMDAPACRRAAVESLSENLTDGYTSAIFWYAVAGLPGLVLFKVVSTMDSMVGYKTERYQRFGWCGARLDDVMNYVPARLTWLLLAVVAGVLPGCSARKALVVGLTQHGVLPGPNSGWSEAATAGGVQRRLVGPIWMQGRLVTDVWIGAADDPPLAARADLVRAMALVTLTGLTTVGLVALGLFWVLF